MKTSSSRVHPTTCAFGPMRQLLAMFREWRAELLRTAFSMMMHSRPILIDPLSAITCAPNMTRQLGPIVTLPQIAAFGAIQAAGSIRGVASSWLIIIWHLCDCASSRSQWKFSLFALESLRDPYLGRNKMWKDYAEPRWLPARIIFGTVIPICLLLIWTGFGITTLLISRLPS